MGIEEVLKLCRYYRGEKENPFEGKDPNKAMLWFYERSWVSAWEHERSSEFDEMISDYMRCGLASFETKDGIPVSLKALLFNRYGRTAQTLSAAVEPFKNFYKKYY